MLPAVPEEGAVKSNFYGSCLEGFCCTETETGEGEGCNNIAVLGSTRRIPPAQQLHGLPLAAGQVAAVSAVRKNYQVGNRSGRIKYLGPDSVKASPCKLLFVTLLSWTTVEALCVLMRHAPCHKASVRQEPLHEVN